jgi:hypothetical protein
MTVSIDDQPPSAWGEADFAELCTEQRRETQTLEFKRELNLDRDRDKNEVEHDAFGMATGGGGVIIFGIEEVELPDGAKAAGQLRPLTDGTLRDRLEMLLDDRGQPHLLFQVHPDVPASAGGFYLVLEIFGRRRPHQAQDKRYYVRRGTRVRAMDEAEVAEAYRDRMLRELAALQPLAGSDGERTRPSSTFSVDVESRIHRGLTEGELALWREESGGEPPPGWMAVVVAPLTEGTAVIDPVRDAAFFQTPMPIPDRWDDDHSPFTYFHFRASPRGLFARLPDRDDIVPGYLVAMHRDGLMEYGTTLAPALRHENPEENRIIFSGSHPAQAHDYLQAFAIALERVGYDGPVAAQVTFENTRGVRLRVGPEYAHRLHPIDEDHIRGDIWRGERAELLDAAGRIVKQVADWVWLAAGSTTGVPFIDEQGHLRR